MVWEFLLLALAVPFWRVFMPECLDAFEMNVGFHLR